ncbi:hypothetical protein R5W24_005770 [Gemmata sp. JC717]|uniref:DUF5655 domain-containing protein n=1 Tax=Gemmata algarum TaxID=2975278 RepID=A0ABU5EU73_9BACT|nr:hypothetical protein [Gemmata algarum]MDY3556602.1 hypothetical protein [Gemmata algarum]MDY3558177.1 hypothetical protein [Gemmata algarum]
MRARSDDILKAEATLWLMGTVAPALEQVAVELRALGRRVDITSAPGAIGFVVRASRERSELDLKFRFRSGPSGVHVLARELVRDGHNVFVHEWPLQAPVSEVTSEHVIEFVVARYRASVAAE